ncbi:MAG: RAD55 family ATPase [Candidatus Methanoperedens sp.]
MIETGIPKMDELLAGGIPEGKSLAYYIQPGVDGGIFGIQTIYNTLKNGRTGVFIVSSTSPDDIRDHIKDINRCYEPDKDRLLFVDGYNPLIGAQSKEKYVISNPYNIEDISNTIMNMLKKLPPSTIVFGSLSTIMDLCGEKETIEAVKTWNNMAKLRRHVLVYNFTAWSYSPQTLDQVKNHLFNAVITIGGIGHVIFSQYFGILKLDWKNEIEQTVSFEPECSADLPEMDAPSPKAGSYLEYEIEGANVRIVGENNMIGFSSF